MAMQDQDFWRRMGQAAPGLFDLGAGLYGENAGRKEGDANLARARGPQYDQAMAASGTALTAAGNMDPQAAAQARFNQAQGLLAGKDAASEDQMMRMLQARGMLGAANYNPGVEGITPDGKTRMNPQMAAFYAGRGARDAGMAFKALNEGEAQTDRMLARSAGLAGQAANQQTSGMQAGALRPSRTAGNMNLLKGVGSIIKNTGGWGNVGGMLGQGYDWLGGQTGLWGDPLRNLDLSGMQFGYNDFDFI